MRATDYNDPVFIEEAIEAIDTLFDYFQDDPRNYVLQVGLLGFWGEWHTFPRDDWAPTGETKDAILNAYLSNLGDEGLTQVRYPKDAVNVPQSGMGYTNGSATLTDHGVKPFGEFIGEHELWRNGPVGGEWPPGIDDKEIWQRFFQTDEGMEFLSQGHYSTMLPPDTNDIRQFIEDWEPDEAFMSMHRQMGYNFQAESIRHLIAADDSGRSHVEVDLHNSGIAPFYKDWDVQLAILDAETANVVDLIAIDSDLRSLGPGETTTLAGSTTATLDQNGQYQIGLRILQPNADQPKPDRWKLDARNTYVVLANDVDVVEGRWNTNNALNGGWNILDDLETMSRVVGDSNGDGIFNPSDLVMAFQAGEYEDDIAGNSTFEEGDWNNDGEFDSSDFVFAFQADTYSTAAVAQSYLAAIDWRFAESKRERSANQGIDSRDLILDARLDLIL